MKKHYYILFLILVLLFSGCNKKVDDPIIKDPEVEIKDPEEPEVIKVEDIGFEIVGVKEGEDIYEGKEFEIKTTIYPSNATDKKIVWKSSDLEVLEVNEGKVKALKEGTAKISFSSSDGAISFELEFEVKKKLNPDIILKETTATIRVGDTYKIEYEIVDSKDKVSFSTKDLDEINLDKDGTVTAFCEGTATITLKLGEIEKEFVITILEKEYTSEELIDKVYKSLDIPSATNADIYLPTLIDGVILDWTSSDRSLLSDKGEVFYSSSLKRVNLYLTLTHGDIDIDKVFNITIRPWSEEVRLEKVLESINLDYCVTSNLDLKTSYDYDVSASWTSSRSDVIDEKGKVNFKDTEIDVILKVKLISGEKTMEKEFSVKTIATKKMNLHYFIERSNEFNKKNMVNLELKDGKIELKKGEVYGYYDSDIYETLKFKELVASWAAISSKTSTCELLVKVKVGENWSKYFTYGVWGLGRNNLYYNQTDKVAKMDTDEILISTNNGCAFQYRIILRRDDSKCESPKLSLVAVTMKMSDAGYKYNVDTSKLPDFVDYDVPKVNQNVVPEIGGSICSATTSTMLLKYKGFDFSEFDEFENRYIANLVADRGHNNPTYGNWVYNTVTMGAFGLDSYVRHMTSWEELKWHLANVGPVGASIKGNAILYTTGGHLIVARGYKVVNGQTYVICNDPNINQRFGNDKNGNPYFVYYEFPLQTFMDFWRGTVYVVE